MNNWYYKESYCWLQVYSQDKNYLWEVVWLLFEISSKKIRGCIYKKWFLELGSFLFWDILKKEKESIFISQKDSQKEFYEIMEKKVINTNRRILWSIYDIECDFWNNLKNIFIDTWFSFSLREKNILKKDILQIWEKQIISYEKNAIIIDDTLFLKENKKILENITKVFINIPNPSYTINFYTYD